MAVTSILDRLASCWRDRVGSAARRALYVLGLFLVLGGAHLARLGTPLSRGLVAGLLACLALLWIAKFLRERRDWSSARRTIGRVLLPTDRALGERALRALTLAERAEGEDFAGSRELARYHFERLLARASSDAVTQSALRRAARWRWVGIGFGGCAVVALVAEIIQRDSTMHEKVQAFIQGSLESAAVTLTPDELGKVWHLIEKHIEIEKETITLARESLGAIEGVKGMTVQAYLLQYLLKDEQKHDEILANLESIKKNMYPYG